MLTGEVSEAQQEVQHEGDEAQDGDMVWVAGEVSVESER